MLHQSAAQASNGMLGRKSKIAGIVTSELVAASEHPVRSLGEDGGANSLQRPPGPHAPGFRSIHIISTIFLIINNVIVIDCYTDNDNGNANENNSDNDSENDSDNDSDNDYRNIKRCQYFSIQERVDQVVVSDIFPRVPT